MDPAATCSPDPTILPPLGLRAIRSVPAPAGPAGRMAEKHAMPPPACRVPDPHTERRSALPAA